MFPRLARVLSLSLSLAALSLIAIATPDASAQEAQGFRLDRYAAPPTTEDGLALQLPSTLGDLRWSAGVMFDYAHAPLVLSAPDRGESAGAIVDHRLVGHVVGALGLTDRVEVQLRVPVILVQTGDSPSIGGVRFASPDVAGIGDGAIGANVRLYGERDEGLQLGIAAELVLPFAVGSSLGGDTEVGFRGQLLVAYALKRAVTVALNAGAAYRPERDFGTAQLGTELTYGLGVYITAIEDLVIAAELFGATNFREQGAFTRTNSPLEALLGARYTISGVTLSGGLGFGITSAIGTPDVRALLGVGYAPPLPEEQVAEVGDRDGDGILDPDDRCPDEPEDVDSFEDEDGCPDLDNDGDGILDPADECPMEPEDIDSFEDENGCPDPDNDGDGIPDATDQCPDEAEDADGWQDEDGCPDLDNDGDGFSDPIDRCPNEAETRNGFEDDDGCPDAAPEQAAIDELSHRILFPHNRDRPTGASRRVIRDLARLLRDHPEIRRVRLEGHADATGNEEYNLELSERRAARVRELLIAQGIEEGRLELVGHGASRLDQAGQDEEAHALNRRVVFTIIERVAPE
ncbi:MAG: OmpA family protein [Myxococcota bacterium]|nr:OmpA family protein [Myxococcota bacterium]